MAENKILLYTLSTCRHCKSAKRLLSDYNFEYTDIVVDNLEGRERKKTIQDLNTLNPRKSFPTIIINKNVIAGYKKNQIKEALGIVYD